MQQRIATNLSVNRQALEEIFEGCSDVVFRSLEVGSRSGLILFVDGIVESEQIHDNLLRPLMFSQEASLTSASPAETETSLSQIKQVETLPDLVSAVLRGQVALLVDGRETACTMSVKGGPRRAVEEPSTEAAIRGPREGFTENLRTNTGLVRHKIKTSNLKMRRMVIGERTQTAVVLAYIVGLADADVVREAHRRLKSIKIDAVLESGYIEELIEDEPFSPFPQFQYSERPDTVAAQLLEGRIAIFVDGTPLVLAAPITLWQMFQASEDYYERFIISTLVRWVRYLFVGVALYLPALYIAVTTFHPDMLPTNLLYSIAAARETIPFPALVEALIMEIAFEALREAGIRLPKTIGQTISILGALVIGQAAVEAGIVSAPAVIIVSLTGIASFTIPRYNAAIAFRILRFPMMVLASTFGLFGIVLGTVWTVLHLCHLRSLGVPYLSGVAPGSPQGWQDIAVRAPWWRMLMRPGSIGRGGQRVAAGAKPGPPGAGR